uniref:Uncharacterized protein n=1 Tax=Plectus sambesii TaxID=2011161 RepID=A0A914UVW7_9BILA
MTEKTNLENNVNYLLNAFYSIPCVEYDSGYLLFIIAMKIAIIFLPVLIIIFTILQKLDIVAETDLAELKAPKIDIDSSTFDFLPKIDFNRLWLYLGLIFFGAVPIVAIGAYLFYLYFEKSGDGGISLVVALGALSFVMMMIVEGLLFFWLYHKLKPEKKKSDQLPGPGRWV